MAREIRIEDLWEAWKELQHFEPPPTEVHYFWNTYHDLPITVGLTPVAVKMKALLDRFVAEGQWMYNPDPYKKMTNRHFIALTAVEHPLEIAVKVSLIIKKPTTEEAARATGAEIKKAGKFLNQSAIYLNATDKEKAAMRDGYYKIEPAMPTKMPIKLSREELDKIAYKKASAAPSWPKLIRNLKAHQRRLYGYVDETAFNNYINDPGNINNILTSESGVMNAKSSTSKTLKANTDAVFKESGLKRLPQGRFRGEDSVDYDNLLKLLILLLIY